MTLYFTCNYLGTLRIEGVDPGIVERVIEGLTADGFVRCGRVRYWFVRTLSKLVFPL